MIIYEYSDMMLYIASAPEKGPLIYYEMKIDGSCDILYVQHFPKRGVVAVTKFPKHFTRNMLKFVFGEKDATARSVLFNIIKYGEKGAY